MNDSNLWMIARLLSRGYQRSQEFGGPAITITATAPGTHEMRLRSISKMGMKGLSWPQSKELQCEGLLSLNEDKLL